MQSAKQLRIHQKLKVFNGLPSFFAAVLRVQFFPVSRASQDRGSKTCLWPFFFHLLRNKLTLKVGHISLSIASPAHYVINNNSLSRVSPCTVQFWSNMEIEKVKTRGFWLREEWRNLLLLYARKRRWFVKYFIRCFELSYAGIHTADHEISATLNFANLTITKLEPLELAREVPSLNIVHYEPVSFQSEVEMPIVKKTAENGHQENGTDKGMFSVSRVKKVELSEIPLASDICSTRKSPLDRMYASWKEFLTFLCEMLSHDLPALALMT